MRAEPGPNIKILLSSLSSTEFCSILEKLSVKLGELGDATSLLPQFMRVDALKLAKKPIVPLPLLELGKEVEELAQYQSKVSFIIRLEGSGSMQTWHVVLAATNIPVLSARRVSVIPITRNHDREIELAKEWLKMEIVHSITTSSPDYSEFVEWALPQAFYIFQKIENVVELKSVSEFKLRKDETNPLWPLPTQLLQAITNSFGPGPIRIPESWLEKRKLLQQMDVCVTDNAKAELEKVRSNLGVSTKAWFK